MVLAFTILKLLKLSQSFKAFLLSNLEHILFFGLIICFAFFNYFLISELAHNEITNWCTTVDMTFFKCLPRRLQQAFDFAKVWGTILESTNGEKLLEVCNVTLLDSCTYVLKIKFESEWYNNSHCIDLVLAKYKVSSIKYNQLTFLRQLYLELAMFIINRLALL